ncbi:MAG TPA: hypothetical protein VMR33_11760 [Candidatus Baltobacteraceae bacterium]|jgi:hypothetical protein|nr:hypothetical protein [Candidatus Baltobacteraceae bacterium]
MDAFWFIPVVLVGIAFLGGFCLYILRLPESPGKPNILVDKPPAQQPEDPVEKQHDWEGRPCGSYLDWLGLERFKKYCSRLERGFLGFGEALAKEHSIRFAVHLIYCAVSRSGL